MMAPGTGVVDLKGLDDVQVLGSWNFTLQADTPLYWLRCGRLDKYLMKFNVHSPCPSTCGIVLHAEADFGGTDGSSFWIERRTSDDGQRTKRYLLSGDGLDSRPIVTRQFPDSGDQPEEIEVLMQGYFGVICSKPEGPLEVPLQTQQRFNCLLQHDPRGERRRAFLRGPHHGSSARSHGDRRIPRPTRASDAWQRQRGPLSNGAR